MISLQNVKKTNKQFAQSDVFNLFFCPINSAKPNDTLFTFTVEFLYLRSWNLQVFENFA